MPTLPLFVSFLFVLLRQVSCSHEPPDSLSITTSTSYYLSPTASPSVTSCPTNAPPYCSLSTVLSLLAATSDSQIDLLLTPSSSQLYNISSDLSVVLSPSIAKIRIVGLGELKEDVKVQFSPIPNGKQQTLRNESVLCLADGGVHPQAKVDFELINLVVWDSVTRPLIGTSREGLDVGKIGVLNITNFGLLDGLDSTGFIMGNIEFVNMIAVHDAEITRWQGGGFVLTDSSIGTIAGETILDARNVRLTDVNYTCGISFAVSTSVKASVTDMRLLRVGHGFHGSGVFIRAKGIDFSIASSSFSRFQYSGIILHSKTSGLKVRVSESQFDTSHGYFGGAMELYCDNCGPGSVDSDVVVDIGISDSQFTALYSQFHGGVGSLSVTEMQGGSVQVSSMRNVYTENNCQQTGGVWSLAIGGIISTISVMSQEDRFDSNYAHRDYGGVYSIDVDSFSDPQILVHVLDSIFIGNHAGFPMLEQGYYDGGVFHIAHGFGSHLQLTIDGNKTVFSNNTGQNGGVFHVRSTNATNAIRMTDGLFEGNRAFDMDCKKICQTGDGGILRLEVSGPRGPTESLYEIEIVGVTFSKNSALRSGGVLQIYEDKDAVGSVSISGNSIFAGNTAQLRGGCLATYKSDVSISDSVFDSNAVGNNGRYLCDGGVLSSKYGSVTVNGGTTMFSNSAEMLGGAVSSTDDRFVAISGPGTSFSGNRAEIGGGAIAIRVANTTSIDLGFAVTLDTNTAGYGGGLFFDLPVPEAQVSSVVTTNEALLSGGGVYFVDAYLSRADLASVHDNGSPNGPDQSTSPKRVALKNGERCRCDEDVKSHYRCTLSGIQFEDGYDQVLTNPSYAPTEFDVTVADQVTHISTTELVDVKFELLSTTKLPKVCTAAITFEGTILASLIDVTHSCCPFPLYAIIVIAVVVPIFLLCLILVVVLVAVLTAWAVRRRRTKHRYAPINVHEDQYL